MNRMRSVFNNVKGEDEECQMEMLDEETEGNTVGFSKFRAASRRVICRNICLLLMASVFIFIIGYITSYTLRTKVCPLCENNTVYRVIYQDSSVLPEEPDPSLSWADITKLLENKLSLQAFTNTLSDVDKIAPRPAGSPEDVKLGNTIFHQFKTLNMEPWIDVHYVHLQNPDENRPNTITFGSNVFRPRGFLAYSGIGRGHGRLVYANYGRPEDFAVLKSYNVEIKDSVLMMRSGKISFAEKVANAEARGATAVLIHPDKQNFIDDTEVFGHVHLGSGDPFTPGLPSFNQTMFSPTKSSGLPTIPAQTITPGMAKTILQTIGGPVPDAASGFGSSLGGVKDITVEVNNVLVSKEIPNVFGVIKGFIDPDRYVVVGAQRDAWGQGYARSTVGTSALIELAKAVHEMVEKDGFRPRRSIVFASWSAGDYGVGATEWLEAYKSALNKVVAYISLDGIVQGSGSFYASGSPLLQTLLENTLKGVKNPNGPGSVHDLVQTPMFRSMSIDDPAYPFLASFGIPSVSFHFSSTDAEEYIYYNTLLDNEDHLNYKTAQRTSSVVASAAQVAGQMALRLVHNHIIGFDVTRYNRVLNSNVYRINKHVSELQKSGKLTDVSTQWLYHARASFSRVAQDLDLDVSRTDLTDPEACRLLNDRLMRIEPSLISPSAAPLGTPYRHLVFGRGPVTLASVTETENEEMLQNQLTLVTWNLQSCANAMTANLWDIQNQI